MGKFIRERLPEPMEYFINEGYTVSGPKSSSWKTMRCEFHGGSDSMRVNTGTGAWVCMSCGERGGDILAFHMKSHGLGFIEAAQALGAWDNEGKPDRPQKAASLSPRAALQVLSFEANLIAVAGGNVAKGVQLTDADLARTLAATNRVLRIAEDYQ